MLWCSRCCLANRDEQLLDPPHAMVLFQVRRVLMPSTKSFLKIAPLKDSERKSVGIPLYPNFDSLDVLGPFQTFTLAGGYLDPKLLAATKAPVRSFEGVEITPHATFDETQSLDVLFVPGGVNLEDVLGTDAPDKNPL